MQRSTHTWRLVAVGLVLAMGLVGAVSAQSLTKVRDIRKNPSRYANEVVTLEGFATQWVEAKAQTTSFYFLKDDWGSVIKVRTSKDKPEIGERYRVQGAVGIDPTNHNDVYVSEEMRIYIREEAAPDEDRGGGVAALPMAVPTAPPAADEGALGGLSNEMKLIIGAIIVVLILLVIVLIWAVRSRGPSTPVEEEYSGTAPAADTPQGEVVEGRTIKMHAPPPGTLKILPGRLEVTAGDETVSEIRFYRVKGQSTPEVTFGRAAGPKYTHIQLKAMTVSKRQAKMTFINNEWILTNFAPETSNPTRHNGIELPEDGQVALKEGDTIALGEVELTFHES